MAERPRGVGNKCPVVRLNSSNCCLPTPAFRWSLSLGSLIYPGTHIAGIPSRHSPERGFSWREEVETGLCLSLSTPLKSFSSKWPLALSLSLLFLHAPFKCSGVLTPKLNFSFFFLILIFWMFQFSVTCLKLFSAERHWNGDMWLCVDLSNFQQSVWKYLEKIAFQPKTVNNVLKMLIFLDSSEWNAVQMKAKRHNLS